MRCTKPAYSKNLAYRIIKGRKVSLVTKKKLTPYLCQNCFSYHITSHGKIKGNKLVKK